MGENERLCSKLEHLEEIFVHRASAESWPQEGPCPRPLCVASHDMHFQAFVEAAVITKRRIDFPAQAKAKKMQKALGSTER